MKRFHVRAGKAPDDGAREMNFYNMGTALRDLDEATKIAKNRPEVLARLGDLKQYFRLQHLKLVWQTTPMEKKRAADDRRASRRVSQKLRGDDAGGGDGAD